jgi:hypothetical protein
VKRQDRAQILIRAGGLEETQTGNRVELNVRLHDGELRSLDIQSKNVGNRPVGRDRLTGKACRFGMQGKGTANGLPRGIVESLWVSGRDTDPIGSLCRRGQ